jgi:hypothetical protein
MPANEALHYPRMLPGCRGHGPLLHALTEAGLERQGLRGFPSSSFPDRIPKPELGNQREPT